MHAGARVVFRSPTIATWTWRVRRSCRSARHYPAGDRQSIGCRRHAGRAAVESTLGLRYSPCKAPRRVDRRQMIVCLACLAPDIKLEVSRPMTKEGRNGLGLTASQLEIVAIPIRPVGQTL